MQYVRGWYSNPPLCQSTKTTASKVVYTHLQCHSGLRLAQGTSWVTHPRTCLGFCALDLGFSLLLLPSTLKYTLGLIVFRPVEVFPGLVGLSNPVFRGFQTSKYISKKFQIFLKIIFEFTFLILFFVTLRKQIPSILIHL